MVFATVIHREDGYNARSHATYKSKSCRTFVHVISKGAIQVLRNAVGGGRVSDFPKKGVT